MQLWIIGVLCISALQICLPNVEASPFESSPAGGFTSHRSGREKSPQFGEGIRDWFRNMRNRIFGGNDQRSGPPAEAANMIIQLEKEDPEERRRNYPGGFFIDLNTLTFNPDRDWGFRLGNWYFIRKTNDEPPPTYWKPPTYPEWPTMGEGDDGVAPPLVTTKPIDVTTNAASMSGGESPEVTEAPVTAEPKDSDNETHIRSDSAQSAEVLIPSN